MTDNATTMPPQGPLAALEDFPGEPPAEKKSSARKDVDSRLRKAVEMAERNAALAARHRKRASRMKDLGRGDSAAKARRLASRAEKLRDRWIHEAHRLKPAAERAAAARRVAQGISLVAQARAARAAAALPQNEAERRAAVKRERLEAQQERARASQMSGAGLSHDPRTAAGRRDLKVEALGGSKRARSQPYKALLGVKATPQREATCERFDALWHASQEGLLPTSRFEPGVDGGKGAGAGPMIPRQASAIGDLNELRSRIGEQNFALLKLRIVDGLDFRALERAGYGSARDLGVLFVAAVDAAVQAWSGRDGSRRALSAALLGRP